MLRIEDLDVHRTKPEFIESNLEDLRWMGIVCEEEPLVQRQRRDHYFAAWKKLKDSGHIYPCSRSRKDVIAAGSAPHDEDECAEPLFPPEWRATREEADAFDQPTTDVHWRFRVPDGRAVQFDDAEQGPQSFVAGKDFGDFVVWRRDDVAAYELAVVVDDIAQGVTEVVRGNDLLLSTARQLLVYEALGATAPAWCHLELLLDETGKRMAKRHNALSMKALRESGKTFQECLADLS